jgi:hypothetical protein
MKKYKIIPGSGHPYDKIDHDREYPAVDRPVHARRGPIILMINKSLDTDLAFQEHEVIEVSNEDIF